MVSRKQRPAPKRPPTPAPLPISPMLPALRGLLPVVLGVALTIRLAALVLGRADPFFEPVLLDSKYYHEWALRILRGDLASPGVFYGLPLYPYFLALCYALFGGSVLTIKLIQIGLGVITILFTYKIAERLGDRAAGLLAAALAAAYGPLFFHETMLVPEALGVPLYAAGFYCCCVFVDAPSVRRGVLTGVILGLACLTKAGVMLFVVIFVVALALRPRLAVLPPSAGALAALALSFAATLAPVALHNRIWGGDWVLLTSHAGLNFYIGNNPQADGVFRAPEGTGIGIEEQIADSRAIAEEAAGRALKPSEVSAYWADRARAFIREHPWRFLALAGKKLVLALDARELSDLQGYESAGRYNPWMRLPWPSFAVLGPLVLAGLLLAPPPRHRWLLWPWIGAYFAGLATFFVTARYRLPLLSVWFVLAGSAVRDLAAQVRTRAWPHVAAYSVVLGAAIWLTQLALVPIDPARDDVNAASLQLKARKYPQALALYDRALSLNPDNAQANLGMGIVLAALGRVEEAGPFYARSVAVSEDPQAYNNLGAWHQLHGDLAAAERAYLRATEIKPTFAKAHTNLGILYAKRGETALAIDTFRTAVRLDPKSCAAETNLGLALAGTGQTDEAERHLARAREIGPGCRGAQPLLRQDPP